VPDRTAESALDSLVTRIDGDNYAQTTAKEMEAQVACLKSKSAMIFQSEIVLVSH
jgi:hypothetical protein